METKRFYEIDFLRAFGIIGVIIVHILTNNLTNPLSKFLWNNLQFVVISFVFCSGFVLTAFYGNAFNSVSKTLSWYKKRFIRLFVPFAIYLVVHFSLWILFPNFFQGLGLTKSIPFFINSLLLIGGTNLNWLPLLFLQLTFLFPFFIKFLHRKKIIAVYLFFLILITGIFTIFKFPYTNYRFVMWAPWSLILLFAIYVSNKEKGDKTSLQTNLRYFILGIVFLNLFFSLYFLNNTFKLSLNFYDHKYPPDFYYLFFGLGMTCITLLIGKLKFWQKESVKKSYLFISKNSYQIFFIHYIILDLVLKLSTKITFFQDSIVQFFIIFFPSLLIAKAIEKLTSLKIHLK